jgi:hypothetical protein
MKKQYSKTLSLTLNNDIAFLVIKHLRLDTKESTYSIFVENK